jgi:hypothetical protein
MTSLAVRGGNRLPLKAHDNAVGSYQEPVMLSDKGSDGDLD